MRRRPPRVGRNQRIASRPGCRAESPPDFCRGGRMADLTIYLGNKNYSSWSLRAWLALKQVGIPFDEVVIPLFQPGSRETILQFSPSGRVPALKHGDVSVWESLAICEYLAETFPAAGLWPDDPGARVLARAVGTEMHAGFAALRQHLPMNVRSRYPDRGVTRRSSPTTNGIRATCVTVRTGSGGT